MRFFCALFASFNNLPIFVFLNQLGFDLKLFFISIERLFTQKFRRFNIVKQEFIIE